MLFFHYRKSWVYVTTWTGVCWCSDINKSLCNMDLCLCWCSDINKSLCNILLSCKKISSMLCYNIYVHTNSITYWYVTPSASTHSPYNICSPQSPLASARLGHLLYQSLWWLNLSLEPWWGGPRYDCMYWRFLGRWQWPVHLWCR